MIDDEQAIARRTARAEGLKGLLERREITDTEMEFRERPGGIVRLGGYGSITEVGYDMGDFTETMARGFARRTLTEEPDVSLLIGHGGLPLARTRSKKGGPGTLRLSEDDHGLAFEADLDSNSSDADLVIRKLRRGDLDGQMSIAFRVTSQVWSDDRSQRRITGITLNGGDLSLVVQAANPHAMAALRAKAEAEAEAARAATAILGRTTSAEALGLRDRERLMQLMADPSRGRPVAASPAVREDYYTRRLRKLRRGE